MKNLSRLLLYSLFAMYTTSCADLDDEFGYNGVVSTPLQAEITDVAPNGKYIVRMYSKIGITQGRADISGCTMVVNGARYDCLIEPDSTIVCTLAGLEFGASYRYSLHATINGMETELAENSFYYNKSNILPEISEVALEMRKPGELTVCADYATLKNFGVTSAVAKIGTKRYDMHFENGKAAFSIDMGELTAAANSVSVTLTNKAGQVTKSADETFSFTKTTIGYDNSQDKILNDCIYMCGTYWAKGQIASNSHIHSNDVFTPGKYDYNLEPNFYWGLLGLCPIPSYFKIGNCTPTEEPQFVNLQGTEHDVVTKMLGKQWGTPTGDQFRKLHENASLQPVEIYDGAKKTGLGFIFYTRKDKKKFCGTSIVRCHANEVYQLGVYLPMDWKIYGYYGTSDYTYNKRGPYGYTYVKNSTLRIDDDENGQLFIGVYDYLEEYADMYSSFLDHEVTLIPVKLTR